MIVMIMGVLEMLVMTKDRDQVLGKPNPFGDGREVKVVKNWKANGHC